MAAPGLAHVASASPTQRSRQPIQLAQEATRTLRECLIQADWKPKKLTLLIRDRARSFQVLYLFIPLFNNSWCWTNAAHGCSHCLQEDMIELGKDQSNSIGQQCTEKLSGQGKSASINLWPEMLEIHETISMQKKEWLFSRSCDTKSRRNQWKSQVASDEKREKQHFFLWYVIKPWTHYPGYDEATNINRLQNTTKENYPLGPHSLKAIGPIFLSKIPRYLNFGNQEDKDHFIHVLFSILPPSSHPITSAPAREDVCSLTQYSSSLDYCIQSPGHQEKSSHELQQERVWTLKALNPGS